MPHSADRELPPVLYMPVRDGSTARPEAEIRLLADGRTTILAYTALDRLIEGCGKSQPWVAIRTDELNGLRANLPFDVVSMDVDVPPELRRLAAK